MKERTEQGIPGVSFEALEEVWKIIDFRINHIARVNGVYFEQNHMCIKFLE